LSNKSYPYIGLLVDSTSTEICWPGPFEEVKPYYDEKNEIHGLKKEVVVLGAALLFSFSSWVRT